MMNAIPDMPGAAHVVDLTDTRALRNAFGCFATGVTIITADSADGPVCITANSFSSISLDPPLVMWAVGNGSRRAPYFLEAEHFAIHVLADAQRDLCSAATKDLHAIATVPYRESPQGVPLLDGSLARFECSLYAVHGAGDHQIILGQVHRATHRTGTALTFFDGAFGTLG